MIPLPASLLALCLLPAEPDYFLLETPSFQIPVHISAPRRESIANLTLHVSRDRGKTWKQVGFITPETPAFEYHAPGDGMYWFTLQVTFKDNTQEPRNIARAPVGQKVVVREKRLTVRGKPE